MLFFTQTSELLEPLILSKDEVAQRNLGVSRRRAGVDLGVSRRDGVDLEGSRRDGVNLEGSRRDGVDLEGSRRDGVDLEGSRRVSKVRLTNSVRGLTNREQPALRQSGQSLTRQVLA